MRLRHGHNRNGHRTPEYAAWAHMIERCRNPSCASWRRYGGRGIRVCDRWLQFENFLADVGQRPSAQHSIDRFPNPDGNYEPGNVRWALPPEQQRNKSGIAKITLDGESLYLGEWAERVGISVKVLGARLAMGWSPERILLTPLRKRARETAPRRRHATASD